MHVCRNPERFAIDAALVQNESLRQIARHFRTTPASLHRHRKHLPVELTQAKQAQDVECATTLLDRVESLMARLGSIAEQAQKDRAWAAAVGAIREVRNCLTQALQQIRIAAKTASQQLPSCLRNFLTTLRTNSTSRRPRLKEYTFARARKLGCDYWQPYYHVRLMHGLIHPAKSHGAGTFEREHYALLARGTRMIRGWRFGLSGVGHYGLAIRT